MQLSLLPTQARTTAIDLGPACVAWVQEGFVPGHLAMLEALSAELPWMQEIYLRGGRIVPAPRLTSYHGDPGTGYVYSGIHHAPSEWTHNLSALRTAVSERCEIGVNAVLVNHYRSGEDGMGYHADDEQELGPTREDIVVACVSLGQARRFVFKRRRGAHKGGPARREVTLAGGSLLLMRGRTQQEWLHALPKTRRPAGPRTSLTFRLVRR